MHFFSPAITLEPSPSELGHPDKWYNKTFGSGRKLFFFTEYSFYARSPNLAPIRNEWEVSEQFKLKHANELVLLVSISLWTYTHARTHTDQIQRQRKCCYRPLVTHTPTGTHPGHCRNFRMREFSSLQQLKDGDIKSLVLGKHVRVGLVLRNLQFGLEPENLLLLVQKTMTNIMR